MIHSRHTWLLTARDLRPWDGCTIDERDRTGSDDNSIAGLINRLESVGRTLTAGHSRMDKIGAVEVTPPDDQRPAYNAALLTVKDEANAIIAVADELLAR